MNNERPNTVWRGEWGMDLNHGYFWHEPCRYSGRLYYPTEFPKNPPKPPYCASCNTAIPKEDEDFFKATWHLLSMKSKQ